MHNTGKGKQNDKVLAGEFFRSYFSDFKVFLFPGSCEHLRVAFIASIASEAVFGLYM